MRAYLIQTFTRAVSQFLLCFSFIGIQTGKLVEWRMKENKYQSSEEAVDYVFHCLDTFLIQWSPWLHLSSFAARRAAYEMTKNLNWPRDSNVFHAGMVNLQSHDTFRMSTVYHITDFKLDQVENKKLKNAFAAARASIWVWSSSSILETFCSLISLLPQVDFVCSIHSKA